MNRNFKRYVRNAAAIASLISGYWAYQVEGNDHNYWYPVAAAMLSIWGFYFSMVWLVQGLRSK